MWTQKWLAAVASAVALAILSPVAVGAETKDDTTKSAATAVKKARPAKPRGRLPAYYRQVVDDTQRLKIYTIQTKFRAESEVITAKIEELTHDLRAELANLEKQQTEDVESVLSADQLAKVEKIRAEAAAKRKAKSAKGSAKATPKTTAKKD
jgi:hypothetical protein